MAMELGQEADTTKSIWIRDNGCHGGMWLAQMIQGDEQRSLRELQRAGTSIAGDEKRRTDRKRSPIKGEGGRCAVASVLRTTGFCSFVLIVSSHRRSSVSLHRLLQRLGPSKITFNSRFSYR